MTFDCFLIIFYQDYVPFPIFRAKTYYIFLNWGCMIYDCFLYSRMPECKVSYFKRYANHVDKIAILKTLEDSWRNYKAGSVFSKVDF